MWDLIHHHKLGLEQAIRTITGEWGVQVVFEGTSVGTDGRTIVLPNVDTFALHENITDEDIENARAYFLALRGYAWLQAAHIVETDFEVARKFRKESGSFALALMMVLDDIRVEHRFADRGPGIREAMEYTREQWAWPRFARKRKAEGKVNPVAEILVGMQVMLKHSENRDKHSAWFSLSPEAKSFVERNSDSIDSAHDTLKMAKTPGSQRLTEVVARMFESWKAEFDIVKPFAKKRTKPVETDTEVKKKEDADVLDLQNRIANEVVDVYPFLLVTLGTRPAALQSAKFDGKYVLRVEDLPTTEEEWEALHPVEYGAVRTLVVCPPNPEEEQALDEAMAKYIRAMVGMEAEMQKEAEEEMVSARAEIDRMPHDQQPYLVYTTKHDIYRTTPNANLYDLNKLRNEVETYYGTVKRRLQILLRTMTMRHWVGHQEEGERLDPDEMANIAMASLLPQQELRPFQHQTEASDLLDTNVGLLVDSSGSMCGSGGRGGSKLHLARVASLCFAECLDMAKVPFALWAFTSNCDTWGEEYAKASASDRKLYGRFGATNIETCKTFDESWTSVATRIPRLGAENQANYDADSVLWAGNQLRTRRAKRRVLFVFSDGLPATSEPALQQARQERHLKDVITGLIGQQIEVVGIGICDSSVQLYYPNNVVIHKADDLPKVTMQEMEFLLLSQNSSR